MEMFLFLAAGAVALFSYLSLTAWIDARKAERTDLERYALYRKLAETPAEAAQMVLDRLREDDARREEDKQAKVERARRDGLQGGAVIMAVGIGISLFLWYITGGTPVWTIGIMLVLIGLVGILFTLFYRPGTKR